MHASVDAGSNVATANQTDVYTSGVPDAKATADQHTQASHADTDEGTTWLQRVYSTEDTDSDVDRTKEDVDASVLKGVIERGNGGDHNKS